MSNSQVGLSGGLSLNPIVVPVPHWVRSSLSSARIVDPLREKHKSKKAIATGKKFGSLRGPAAAQVGGKAASSKKSPKAAKGATKSTKTTKTAAASSKTSSVQSKKKKVTTKKPKASGHRKQVKLAPNPDLLF